MTKEVRVLAMLGERGECDQRLKVVVSHWHCCYRAVQRHILEGVLRLPRKRIIGWRVCLSALVAFIV